jgi:hypothetical protein
MTRRTKAFHHYTLGGELTVEDETILDEHVDEVSCRWCGHGHAIERVDLESGEAEPAPTGEPSSPR